MLAVTLVPLAPIHLLVLGPLSLSNDIPAYQ